MIEIEKFKSLIEEQVDDRAISLVKRAVWQRTGAQFARDLAALDQPITVDWAARYGLQPSSVVEPDRKPKRSNGLSRASCAGPVNSEAIFCRVNKPRFGGNVYCRACQQTVAPD